MLYLKLESSKCCKQLQHCKMGPLYFWKQLHEQTICMLYLQQESSKRCKQHKSWQLGPLISPPQQKCHSSKILSFTLSIILIHCWFPRGSPERLKTQNGSIGGLKIWKLKNKVVLCSPDSNTTLTICWVNFWDNVKKWDAWLLEGWMNQNLTGGETLLPAVIKENSSGC